MSGAPSSGSSLDLPSLLPFLHHRQVSPNSLAPHDCSHFRSPYGLADLRRAARRGRRRKLSFVSQRAPLLLSTPPNTTTSMAVTRFLPSPTTLVLAALGAALAHSRRYSNLKRALGLLFLLNWRSWPLVWHIKLWGYVVPRWSDASPARSASSSSVAVGLSRPDRRAQADLRAPERRADPRNTSTQARAARAPPHPHLGLGEDAQHRARSVRAQGRDQGVCLVGPGRLEWTVSRVVGAMGRCSGRREADVLTLQHEQHELRQGARRGALCVAPRRRRAGDGSRERLVACEALIHSSSPEGP